MALEYDLREKPNPNGNPEKQALYPRVVVKGRITTEKLVKDIAGNTTFSEGEIVGVMRLLSDRMARYIKDGYSVELEDIGYFTASLTARPVMDKKELRSPSVAIRGVNFRLSSGMKRKLAGGDLIRSRWGFRKSEDLPTTQRKRLLDEYLEKNGFITRREYSHLTGLLKSSALRELNNWVESGLLKTRGKRNTKIFLSARNEQE